MKIFEADLEYDYAAKIIRGEAAPEDYPLHRRFGRLIGAEISLAHIQPTDRVLFIGSGPLPISAILLHQRSGAHVDCHDISPEACDISRQLLGKLELTDHVSVIDVSGDKWAYPQPASYNYSAIVVAALAQPKGAIGFNIFQGGPRHRSVIFRDSEDNRRLFYAGMQAGAIDVSGDFELTGEHHAGIGDTLSSKRYEIAGLREKI